MEASIAAGQGSDAVQVSPASKTATAIGKYASIRLWWYVKTNGARGFRPNNIREKTSDTPSVKCFRPRSIVMFPVSSFAFLVDVFVNRTASCLVRRRSQTQQKSINSSY